MPGYFQRDGNILEAEYFQSDLEQKTQYLRFLSCQTKYLPNSRTDVLEHESVKFVHIIM